MKHIPIGPWKVKRHLCMIFLTVGVILLIAVHVFHKHQVDGLGDLFLLPAGDRILEKAEQEL